MQLFCVKEKLTSGKVLESKGYHYSKYHTIRDGIWKWHAHDCKEEPVVRRGRNMVKVIRVTARGGLRWLGVDSMSMINRPYGFD